jgi:hypothetical protein
MKRYALQSFKYHEYEYAVTEVNVFNTQLDDICADDGKL